MTTANKIKFLENKLESINNALNSLEVGGIYNTRKAIRLNELANKTEKRLEELKK